MTNQWDIEDDDDETVDPREEQTKARNQLIDKYVMEMTLPTSATDEQWCEENNVVPRTLRRWKKLPEFRKKQKQFVSRKHLDPTRLGAVLENLWRIASTEKGNHAVTAASMYIKYAETLEPASPADMEVPVGFKEMTHDQLVAAAMVVPDQAFQDGVLNPS